jgi:hypothetical protein
MRIPNLACAALLAAFSTGAAAVGGLAELAVYDRSEGRSLPVYWHEGRAWVVGKPGNEYQLKLRNRQGEDLLAVLSVDGVNAISGETAGVRQSGYVLPTGGSLEVKGWRKDLSRTAAFYFTPLADSYAARTGRPDHVGAIGVALFRRRAPEPAPLSQIAPSAKSERSGAGLPIERSEAGPPIERSDAASGMRERAAAAEAPLGTGHGRSEASHARRVGFERATREPAETVVIYYDSYRNLLARGIIAPQIPRRRLPPNPFPGFVSDPPA